MNRSQPAVPRFSIIVVTWNALPHLKVYLPSVVATDHDSFEIILADNHSRDGSVEWVQEQFPHVRVVRHDRNYGFCRGNNRAVPHASGDILVFLNNDVAVDADWLHPLEEAFSRKEVAAAQPKLRSWTQPNRFEYAGAAGGFLDRYGFPYCRGRVFDHLEEDRGQYDGERPVFWASGAAMAVRRQIFEEEGGFDEDFEFHMEEIDLCWRLWNRGYEVLCCPRSTVYHLGGGSMPMGSPRKVYYNYRNSLSMLWKNYSRRSLAVDLPVRVLLDLVALLRALLTGKGAEAGAMIRAYRDFLKRFGQVREKRKTLEKLRNRNGNPPVMSSFPIVWAYFIAGKKTFAALNNDNT